MNVVGLRTFLFQQHDRFLCIDGVDSYHIFLWGRLHFFLSFSLRFQFQDLVTLKILKSSKVIHIFWYFFAYLWIFLLFFLFFWKWPIALSLVELKFSIIVYHILKVDIYLYTGRWLAGHGFFLNFKLVAIFGGFLVG